MPIVSCQVDSSGINKMLSIAATYSKRTPAVAVNTTALVVARFAWSKMPVTSQERIDTELAVISTPVISTRGARKGLPLKSGRKTIVGVAAQGGEGKYAEVPLAALIVNARVVRPDVARSSPSMKRYNELTGMYWGLVQSPFRGVSRSEGAALMTAAIERMVKARHSSTHFLQSCWIPAIRLLEPYADPSITRRRSSGPTAGAHFVDNSGYAMPARSGDVYASAEIANDAGGAGSNQVMNAKHNDALWRLGLPVLQQAIDDEAGNIMKYVAEKKFAEDFEELRSLGFEVKA